ncbi:MAG: ABC transporter ATP-binding protein [candidate division Zixibacteria bacterium]|nr:ABC transporter ATP-binding protein [candidate division Zixibacteria bacterium]
MMLKLTTTNLSRRFGSRKLFSDLNFELTTGDSMAITGPNGSGKSTLMMILTGLLRPSKGSVAYCDGDVKLTESARRSRVAFVAPYLNLYDQLTGEENLKFFAAVSGISLTGKVINHNLSRIGLQGRGGDPVGEYSSGMKQRLKYGVALSGDPDFIFLDEPTCNLDDNGKKTAFEMIEELRNRCVIVIATNEKREYGLGVQQCRLGQ